MKAQTPRDLEQFEQLAERYRGEIQLHCYRMLGSVHDAEDVVQETLLRAWRGLSGLHESSALRAWLYRIATNECVRAIGRSKRGRVLPETEGPPAEFAPLGPPDSGTAWIEPYPTTELDALVDLTPGPEARYEAREALQLAFIAAIQELPPRQRAVLLLRDVLGWSGAETAGLLETTVASVNSALQRARATLERRFPDGRPPAPPPPNEDQRRVLDRYVRAWEDRDLDEFVALLAKDALWTMPPWPQWYVGHAAIGAFMDWAWRPDRRRRQLLVPTSANGRPSFAYYRAEPDATHWQAFAIQVLDLRAGEIAAITNFVDGDLFPAFGLPITRDR